MYSWTIWSFVLGRLKFLDKHADGMNAIFLTDAGFQTCGYTVCCTLCENQRNMGLLCKSLTGLTPIRKNDWAMQGLIKGFFDVLLDVFG